MSSTTRHLHTIRVVGVVYMERHNQPFLTRDLEKRKMNENTDAMTWDIGGMKIAELYLLCTDICEAAYKVQDIRGTFECPNSGRHSPMSDLHLGIRSRRTKYWPLKSVYSRTSILCAYISLGGGDRVDAEELDKMFIHEILYMSVAAHLWDKTSQRLYATILTQLKIMGRVHRHILLNYGLGKFVRQAALMDYGQAPVDVSQPEEVAV